MDSYILIGIVGTATDKNDNLFVVHKFRAYNIADCCLYDFSINKVTLGDVKISGIIGLDIYKDHLDNGVPLIYNSNNFKFYVGSRDVCDVGKLPVYSSDTRKSGFGNYSGDLDIENNECKYLKVIMTAHCCEDDSDLDDYTTSLPVSLIIPTDGGRILLANGEEPLFESRCFDEIESTFSDSLYVSAGNVISPSYCLNYLNDAYTLEGLVENGIVKVKGKGRNISQVVAEGIHLISFSSFGNETVITDSDCKIVYMTRDCDVPVVGNGAVVINPNVKVLIDNSDDSYTYKNKNTIIISRSIDMDVFINYVRCFEFDNDRTIGFGCYSFVEDDYPGMLEKCKELSKIIHSNDRTHRIFNDIDYFVDRLNEIGFNIELY